MSDTDLRVLFVDDEPRVLAAITRMMFDVANDWVIDTASSGEAALTKLASADYAVVVSDMHMPGMDGAALLSRVAEEYPRIVRVVLSGQTDEEAIMGALHVAHRFLAKPCKPEALYEVVRRTRRLVSELSRPELRARISHLGPLPSPPTIYLELTRLLKDGEAPMSFIAAIVNRDPSLCSRVLQIANSAFFCRAGPLISDARIAIARIGTRIFGHSLSAPSSSRPCRAGPSNWRGGMRFRWPRWR